MNWEPPCFANTEGSGFVGRHTGMCSACFLDGHVKALSLPDMYANYAYYFSANSKIAGQGQALP